MHPHQLELQLPALERDPEVSSSGLHLLGDVPFDASLDVSGDDDRGRRAAGRPRLRRR